MLCMSCCVFSATFTLCENERFARFDVFGVSLTFPPPSNLPNSLPGNLRDRARRMPLHSCFLASDFHPDSCPVRYARLSSASLAHLLILLYHFSVLFFPVRSVWPGFVASVLSKTSPTARGPCSCPGVLTFPASTRTRTGSSSRATSGRARCDDTDDDTDDDDSNDSQVTRDTPPWIPRHLWYRCCVAWPPLVELPPLSDPQEP